MTQRRKLVDAITDPPAEDRERDFVFSEPHKREAKKPHPTPRKVALTPLTTRLRDDYAQSMKRVSLQRQLDGIEPHSLQDILEEAVAAWLAANGELPRE